MCHLPISDKNKDCFITLPMEDLFNKDICKKIEKYYKIFKKLQNYDLNIYYLTLTRNFLIMVNAVINEFDRNKELIEHVPHEIVEGFYQARPLIEIIEGFIAGVSPHIKKKQTMNLNKTGEE